MSSNAACCLKLFQSKNIDTKQKSNKVSPLSQFTDSTPTSLPSLNKIRTLAGLKGVHSEIESIRKRRENIEDSLKEFSEGKMRPASRTQKANKAI